MYLSTIFNINVGMRFSERAAQNNAVVHAPLIAAREAEIVLEGKEGLSFP